MQTPIPHRWLTPQDIAAQLDAKRHGSHWRAKCPAHGGDNPTSLAISEGVDKDGHPCTLLYCHAHQCKLDDICTAIGIERRNLFLVTPDASPTWRNAPRDDRIKKHPLAYKEQANPDDITEVMLDAMLTDEQDFLDHCPPAREKLWHLCQDPMRLNRLLTMLRTHGIIPQPYLVQLRNEFSHG